jgi:hypothetical protein
LFRIQYKDLPSHDVGKQLSMEIAPEMKPIKARFRETEAEHDSVSRFNPNPEGGEGIDDGRATRDLKVFRLHE